MAMTPLEILDRLDAAAREAAGLAALAQAAGSMAAQASADLRAALALPAPQQPPAPSPTSGAIEQPIDMSRLVVFDQWQPELGASYDRAQGMLRLPAGEARIRISGYGGAPRRLSAARYTLLVDGAHAAEVAVPAGSTSVVFDADLTGKTGWVRLGLANLVGESCPTWWAWVGGEQKFTPVARASYELAMGAVNASVLAPATYAPTPRPTTLRPLDPFATAIARNQLHVQHLVPLRWGDTHRVCRTHDGALTSSGKQSYHWYHFTRKLPLEPLLDGPRGVGTVCMATHLMMGTAVLPGIGWRGVTYFCDPWRIGKVSADGHVTTLAGYRHKGGIASHWQSPPDLELLGDWSAVPVERRGFHELWGLAWDERTLAVDENAPVVPGEGLHPHAHDPVLFAADSQNNRICKLEFSRSVREAPPKVTEHVTGLRDPWDVVCRAGVLYVSERQAHRISMFDATTGAFIDHLVVGGALALIDKNREVVRTGSLEACRAAPCVAPEGLYLLDDWLYFASLAQAQVRRIPLAPGHDFRVDDGAVQVVCGLTTDNNSKFAKLAVSDGTFGPEGSLAVAMWSNGDYGWPQTRKPDGTRWEIANSTPDVSGNNGQFVYVTAAGISHGRMLVGGTNEGLLVITRRRTDDSGPSAAATRGSAEYRARHLDLLHGQAGFGFYGLPLPWGISADIDAALMHWGHIQTS